MPAFAVSTFAYTINVHLNCEISARRCTIKDSLEIYEPIQINFVDNDIAWDRILDFNFAPDSNVTVMPVGIFEQFTEIRYFRMSTGLKRLNAEDFKHGKKLMILELQNNAIAFIPSHSFVGTEILFSIDLSRNELSRIDDFAFSGLVKLREIFLNNNSLTGIKRNTFAGAVGIKQLQLEHNRIEYIEAGAFDLPELESINLVQNKIRSLADSLFAVAVRLFKVDLSANYLVSIGQSFDNLTDLHNVILNDNRIDDIDLSAFARLPKLERLSLRNSGFSFSKSPHWPSLRYPSTLKYLDLSNNGISERDVVSRLADFLVLDELNLEDNQLSELDGLDEITFKFLRLISRIGLSGNRFTCEKLQDIIGKLSFQSITVIGHSEDAVKLNKKNINGVTCL